MDCGIIAGGGLLERLGEHRLELDVASTEVKTEFREILRVLVALELEVRDVGVHYFAFRERQEVANCQQKHRDHL